MIYCAPLFLWRAFVTRDKLLLTPRDQIHFNYL